MRGACTWHQWRDNILNGYNNDTEDNLEELLDDYVYAFYALSFWGLCSKYF